jgi:gliding motility-associated-like protein/uncharacterized repeat protein (TIGR01451 family)
MNLNLHFLNGVKTSQFFGNQIKNWVNGLGKQAKSYDYELTPILNNQKRTKQLSSMMLGIFMFLASFSAFAQSPDLKVKMKVSNSLPTIGATVSYTVTVKNEGGADATGVKVSNKLPTGGVSYVSNSVLRGTGSFTSSSGEWNVGTISKGDSAILKIDTKVESQGVWFNIAEVSAMTGGTDPDSTPGNDLVTEDDYDAACFSVPITWYPGYEFTVSIPTPGAYTTVEWYKNGVLITSSTPGVTINSDKTLTIKSVGRYGFRTTLASCPQTGCCDIILQQGPYGSIGDYVWKDVNANGIQDTDEKGIPNATVELYTVSSTGVTSTTPAKIVKTNSSGAYLFDSLMTGDYKVKFVTAGLPADCNTLTDPNKGGDPTKDSDAGTDGFSPKVSINAEGTGIAKNNLTIDAGIVPIFGSIGDFVWKDVNGNGIQDAGEKGVKDVIVKLWSADASGKPVSVLKTATTDINGYYMFSDLPKADYIVQFVTDNVPADCRQITPPNKGTDPELSSKPDPTTGITPVISIDPSIPTKRNVKNVDAGLIPALGSIGDFVWKDVNGNGIQDAGEKGVKDVIVKLWSADATGKPIAVAKTTTTDINGYYNFDGISSGNYVVQFVMDNVPADCRQITDPGKGTDPNVNSKPDPTTGITPLIVIDTTNPTKKDIKNIDAGLVPTLGSIGDYVWKDVNENGIQDLGEKGVKNVTVKLWSADASGKPVSVLKTTTTDANGYYSFDGLSKADYIVQFITDGLPADCNKITDPNKGTNPDLNSKADPTTGITPVIKLDPGVPGKKNITNIDAGLKGNCVPPIVKVGPDKAICMGETSTIRATSDAGTSIKWYLSSIGGTSIASSDSGVDYIVSPSTTTTYYAEAVRSGVDNCVSTRVPVVIVVNARPSNPTCVGNVSNVCPSTSVNLDTHIINAVSTAGGVFEWHVGPSPTSALVANKATAGAGTYYVFEKSTAGCYSNPTLLTVNIIPCSCINPAIAKAGDDIKVCQGDPINLAGSIGGSATSATWSTSGTGTFANASSLVTTYTPSAADVAAGNVTIKLTTNVPTDKNCSAVTDGLILTLAPTPDAPYGLTCADSELCLGESTKLFGIAPGNTIKWYTSATGGSTVGSTLSGGGLVVTPTATTTYYAEAVNANGCAGKRTPITVNVGKCFADLAVEKKIVSPSPFTSGQTITYSIEVKNLGPVAATSVEVKDVLPAELTFVNAAPVGYNQITGVWSVGNLANGASKVLLITATINSGSTITNTAVVTSPDNDLTKTGNDKSSVTIEVIVPCNVKPPIVTCAKTTICAGESVTLNALGCDGTVTWSSGNIGSSLTVSPTENISYSAVCTVGKCTSIASEPKAIIVNKATPPVVSSSNSSNKVCAGASITLNASGCDGTVTWSNGMTGNTITVIPTTGSTYSATCRKGDCVSGPSNVFTPVIITTTPPTVVYSKKEMCAGESMVLNALNCDGTVTWSTGQTGTSITINPTATTTYTATCTVDGCVSSPSEGSTITINSPAVPIITSATTNVCAGASVTLNTAGCTGTVLWSNGATGASITVNPLTSTSYTATCKVGDCTSAVSNTMTITVGSVVAPVVTASATALCGAGSVTLTATGCNGAVTWSNGQTANPLTLNVATTTSYSAICVDKACSSPKSNEVTVVITPAPDAPIITCTKNSICAGENVTLTAANCSGIINWSTGQVGSSIVVTPSSTTTYTATCSVNNCKSGVSTGYIVTVSSPSAPVLACVKESICSGESATITSTGCTGTLVWSNGATESSITVSPTTTTTYTAICKVGDCTSAAATKTITVNTATPPVLSCSTETVCVGTSISISAVGCTGTVTWSTGATGNILTVTPTVTTAYSATCTNGSCVSAPSSIKTVTVVVNPSPTITSSVTTGCESSSALLTVAGCTGTITWSTGETGSSITVSKDGEYTATCAIGSCPSKPASIKIALPVPSPIAPPVITSVFKTTCNSVSAVLTATGCASTITWSDGSTGPNITVTTGGTYSAKCGSTCPSTGTITVVMPLVPVYAPPVISSNLEAICVGGSATLTATGCTNGTVVWSTGAIGNSLTVTPSSTTSYTAVCKNGECLSGSSNSTTISIVVPVAPVITASSTSVCSGSNVTLTSTGCAGTVLWSTGQSGSSISVTASAATVISAVCTYGACNSGSSNKINISIVSPEVPVISCTTSSICTGESVNLLATGCTGTVEWSNGATGETITVSPTATATYSAVCVTGTCKSASSSIATITVGSPAAPNVFCETTSICAGANATLKAAGCNGTVIWSNGMEGNLVTVNPQTTTSYTAICTGKGCQSGISNTVTIAVGTRIAKPTTKPLTNACPFTVVNLNTGVTSSIVTSSGVFEFRTGNSSTSPLVVNPSQVSEGTYYVFEKSGNGCYSEGTVINVDTISCKTDGVSCTTNPAIAQAGTDLTACAEKVINLSGKISGAAKTATWTTSGSGTFSNPLSLTSTYTASLADIVAGTVKLTLKTDDPDGTGPCVAGEDEVIITLTGPKTKPTISATGSLTRCAGDAVTLTASEGAKYKWSNGATTKAIEAKTSGKYTVTVYDAAGCASIASDEIEVIINGTIVSPIITNSTPTNVCPATTVDLTGLDLSATAGLSQVFLIGNTPGSNAIVNPKAVGAGTYYVFNKTLEGCYSTPKEIKVSITSCSTSTTGADLSIVKKADKSKVAVGGNLLYTFEVKNNGPVVATGVKIKDVLPAGLEFVSGAGLTNTNGTLTGTIAKIEVGSTVSLTALTKVTEKGTILNAAVITGADQPDPQPTDNTGTVTANDTTFYAGPGRLGIAKSVTSTSVKDNVYDVTYTFTLSNIGGSELKKVQVLDTLSNVFKNGATFEKPTLSSDAGLAINEAYTGKDGNTALLVETASSLPAGATRKVTMVVRVDVSKAGTNSTYDNIATAKAVIPATNPTGTETPVDDRSVPGTVVDPDKDGNPKNNTGGTGVTLPKVGSPVSPNLGIAYAVKDTIKQANGSYNVTYWVIVKNTGATPLAKIALNDTLSKAFVSPVTYTVVNKPTSVKSASTLVVDADFNGASKPNLLTDASNLAVGVADTIKFTINVVPGTAKGPFSGSVYGAGTAPDGTVVTKKSSNGFDPTVTTGLGTPLLFGQPASRIGLAKTAALPVRFGTTGNVYDITYTIKVCNVGTTNLTNITVKDDLSEVFTKKGATITADKIIVNGEAGLVINPNYTGQGLNTALLDTGSTVEKGKSKSVSFTVRVDFKSAKDSIFNNIAIGRAKTPEGTFIEDASTNGTECGIDPSKEGEVTPVKINVSGLPQIGLAMAVTDTTKQTNGSYNVTYKIVVKNYGREPLKTVTVTDSLSKAFSPAVFKLVGLPTLNSASKLKINKLFNGGTDPRMLVADSSSLATAGSDTIKFVVNVMPDNRNTPYLNSAIGTAIGLVSSAKTTDVSTNGLNPDKNNDNSPSSPNEDEATPLLLKFSPVAFSIPEGFSPNGDGVNDLFVVAGVPTGSKVNCTVFNRWGHCVYQMDDYKNNWGGEVNQGVKFGNGGLPDGTYWYKVIISDDTTGASTQHMRFFTIAR